MIEKTQREPKKAATLPPVVRTGLKAGAVFPVIDGVKGTSQRA